MAHSPLHNASYASIIIIIIIIIIILILSYNPSSVNHCTVILPQKGLALDTD